MRFVAAAVTAHCSTYSYELAAATGTLPVVFHHVRDNGVKERGVLIHLCRGVTGGVRHCLSGYSHDDLRQPLAQILHSSKNPRKSIFEERYKSTEINI